MTLKRALKKVRYLVELLRNAPSGDGGSPDGDIRGMIDTRLGGVRLTGREAELFGECEEALEALHASDRELSVLSRDAAHRLLRTAVLEALRVKKADQSRKTFEGRLGRALRKLRRELRAPPKEWEVNIQVRGLASSGLPFDFGGVTFAADGATATEPLAQMIADFKPRGRVAKRRLALEQRSRETSRTALATLFASHPIATVTVAAIDDEAARRIAVERIRRTVDTINFFAPFFHERPLVYRAFVAPDAEPIALPRTVRATAGKRFFWSAGGVGERPVTMIDPVSSRAVEIGLARAGTLLASASPSDFDQRLLTALSWAGRATVEPRRDEAFLLFAIALEAVLTNSRSRGGVTDRVRLRTAHLLGSQPETRKRIAELVSDLYRRRSTLVHSGDSTELTDDDLSNLRAIVQRALTHVLTDERFTSLANAAAFERLLDERVFG